MKFDQIETPDELKLYLDSPFVYKSTVKCFYHYTTLDSLAEISMAHRCNGVQNGEVWHVGYVWWIN